LEDAPVTITETYDVAVVGAGPAGLIAGLALAETGFSTSVIGPRPNPNDSRTAALFQGSIELLKRVGAWPQIAVASEPLDAIRLIDATGALIRAPEVTFRASEIGQDAFGYNVPNAVLTAELERLAVERVTRIITPAVARIETGSDGVSLETADGATFTATLVAAADGRASPCRAAAGISVRQWSYDQAAIVCGFTHTRGHKRISTEFHRRAGPLTIVPGPGNSSNLVWVETKAEAERLAALPDAEFISELSRHLAGLVGTITAINPRNMFPLSGQTADPLAKNRIALIGESGHVIPPIGAQGLNLGFRDAATLADIAADARTAGEDIGGDKAMAAYDKARRPDVTSRVWTVDVLNRSLLSQYTPVHMLRGLGLFALSTVAPLRHRLMREGMAPQNSTPNLMRPAPRAP
jgi:2-octaprenyl-6-methoxyphenol hydroxylase